MKVWVYSFEPKIRFWDENYQNFESSFFEILRKFEILSARKNSAASYCFSWMHLAFLQCNIISLQHKDKVPLIGFKLELTKLGIFTIVAVSTPKIESLLG